MKLPFWGGVKKKTQRIHKFIARANGDVGSPSILMAACGNTFRGYPYWGTGHGINLRDFDKSLICRDCYRIAKPRLSAGVDFGIE